MATRRAPGTLAANALATSTRGPRRRRPRRRPHGPQRWPHGREGAGHQHERRPGLPDRGAVGRGPYEALGWALGAGARGFVLKEAPGDDIVRAVRAVAAGGAWLDPSITTQVPATYRDVMSRTEERRLPNLTTRELDVPGPP